MLRDVRFIFPRSRKPLCPPFFLLRGYPGERISYGSGGAFRAVFQIRCRTNEMVC
jgi:hypothetical protein